jgi:hypothetical protein
MRLAFFSALIVLAQSLFSQNKLSLHCISLTTGLDKTVYWNKITPRVGLDYKRRIFDRFFAGGSVRLLTKSEPFLSMNARQLSLGGSLLLTKPTLPIGIIAGASFRNDYYTIKSNILQNGQRISKTQRENARGLSFTGDFKVNLANNFSITAGFERFIIMNKPDMGTSIKIKEFLSVSFIEILEFPFPILGTAQKNIESRPKNPTAIHLSMGYSF